MHLNEPTCCLQSNRISSFSWLAFEFTIPFVWLLAVDVVVVAVVVVVVVVALLLNLNVAQ